MADPTHASATAPTFRLGCTVLGTPDPQGLAAFYQQLLGYAVVSDGEDPAEWVRLEPDGGGPGLAFQREQFHREPTWPGGPADQQMQLHLDILVDDLAAAAARAVAVGARVAAYQPDERCRVMVDPAGHPFCLFETF
jgi:catechol 2,3-dioxygenase-like lactoylglutathione lyase family enzyme